MILTLANVVLLQQPQRISWAVWSVIGFVFVLAVSLLVYFIGRMRRARKEPEEDWTSSRRSLFVAGASEKLAGEHGEATGEAGSTRTVESAVAEAPAVIAPGPESLPPNATSSLAAESSAVADSRPPEAPATEQASMDESAAVESQALEDVVPFDDDVWAALDGVEQGESSTVLAGVAKRGADSEPGETGGFARVEGHSARESLVAEKRERFERPTIEPLVPRERLELHEPSQAQRIPEPAAPAPTRIDASAAGPAQPQAVMLSLANYGKEAGQRGGHAGTIALLAVIVLVGGSGLAYFKSATFHHYVDRVVSQVRTAMNGAPPAPAVDATTQAKAEPPRALVFPSRTPEVIKNIVKARGAVDNTSDAALEGLSLEVTLERGDGGAPEVRSVPVKPDPLAKGQRGIYEFEYDGRQFRAYRLTRLLSNGNEVKFVYPGQQ